MRDGIADCCVMSTATSESIRDEKVKVLKAIPALSAYNVVRARHSMAC